MLQMGSGEPSIARVPEAIPADTLRVGALDPGPWRILLREGIGGLGSVHMTQDTCGKKFLPTSPSAWTVTLQALLR
jgi:hypothetical protein